MVDYSRQINPLEIADYVNQRGDAGRARGEGMYLNRLMGEAYTAPDAAGRTSALQKLAKTHGQQAIAADTMFQQRDDAQLGRRRELLSQRAGILVAMPAAQRAAAWPSIKADLVAQDPALAGLPDVYDDAQFGPVIQQLAGGSNGAPAGFQELHMKAVAAGLLPGTPEYQRAMRIGVGIEGRASSAGFGFDMVEDANGNPRPQRRNPRNGSVEVFHAESGQWVPLGAAGGPVQQRTGSAPPQYAGEPAGALGVLGGISALSQTPGVTTTSLYRDPTKNADVGGVTNSQHMAGTAGDFVVPASAKPAFMAQARALGFEAIDEGDHVHVELPPGASGGGMAGMGGGGGPAASGAPVAPPARPADPYANSPYLRTNITEVGGGGSYPELGIGRRPEDEAAATEAAKRRVGLQFAPEEAAAAADAARLKKSGELEAERTEAQRGQGRTYQLYKTASDGLRDALAGTTTGPVAGRMPALTADAQIAEGGVAAMAPVLKQLFRSAGEGVFTDKDQELLMRMLPTRTDHPEAAKAKLEMIDNIVQAKLGVSAGESSGGKYQVGQIIEANGKRYRVTGGDPSDPDVEEVQ